MMNQPKRQQNVFLIGGARSGKTRWAIDYAQHYSNPCYIATAQAWDHEMAQRIQRHQAERGPNWRTIEAGRDLAAAVRHAESHDIVVIDCITVWLGQWFDHTSEIKPHEEERFWQDPVEPMIKALLSCPGKVLVISNEVGTGIVPENPLARRYRDRLGFVNQCIAQTCDTVLYFVAGLPLPIKGSMPE